MKQPRALTVLFFTEIGLCFGLYILQSLLVLYLTEARGLVDSQAYELTGEFFALVYLVTLAGGSFADRHWPMNNFQ